MIYQLFIGHQLGVRAHPKIRRRFISGEGIYVDYVDTLHKSSIFIPRIVLLYESTMDPTPTPIIAGRLPVLPAEAAHASKIVTYSRVASFIKISSWRRSL